LVANEKWYEQAYPGAKMVPVPGFPRPLYPPDAAEKGKTPSSDGPDVEAYKRTVSRAGRWPWQKFDEAYSNAFAHGKVGGDYKDSGVAGIQSVQGIKPSGWLGKSTFNTLRSIVIPQGLPHAGEHAMDVNAQNLIAEAWALYGGAETPPPAPELSTRERALQAAVAELGYKESPAESNNTKYGSWYGVNYQPWCAIFCTWCYVVKAGGSSSFERGSQYAYCPYVVSDARNQRNGLSVPSSPLPGDLVVYAWGSSGQGTEEFDHIGIFEGWTGGSSFTAIEGNTSTSNDSNGGQVMRRQRSTGGQGTEFVRVAD
jgi:hypothetical protein